MNNIPAPEVFGLILAGGRSTRMGMDKSKLVYHGVPQYQYLTALLSSLVEAVFISCRKEQQFDGEMNLIVDEYEDIGPLSGVLSALQFDPTKAWMVLACDLPYVDAAAVNYLYSRRQTWKQATYFTDPSTHFPEPLFTIFEPSMLPVLLQAFHAGQFSLNKVLQRCDGNANVPEDVRWLRSVNTREEMGRYGDVQE